MIFRLSLPMIDIQNNPTLELLHSLIQEQGLDSSIKTNLLKVTLQLLHYTGVVRRFKHLVSGLKTVA
ncbi:MAG: hypothetical protein HQK72_17475 [Desulfamplus sp.]|nr:hypothetical protein [Desulfamplus sp.]